MDANTYRFDELIGPLSSLFWLAYLDELAQAVFDPSIALDDKVRPIPVNVGVSWILEHLFEEGKLPGSLYDRYFFETHQPPVAVMPTRLDPIRHKLETSTLVIDWRSYYPAIGRNVFQTTWPQFESRGTKARTA